MSMKWRRVFLLSLTVGLTEVAAEQRWNTSGTPSLNHRRNTMIRRQLTLTILGWTLLQGFLAIPEALADITNWNNNPSNWKNNSANWENNPSNWKNNPANWENNPNNYNATRIIRDNSGHAEGYEVPKPDGGVNYFDLDGHREGYKAGDD